MPWYAWASVALNVVLLACAYHYWDVARAKAAQARYWAGLFDKMQNERDAARTKYRTLLESMVRRAK